MLLLWGISSPISPFSPSGLLALNNLNALLATKHKQAGQKHTEARTSTLRRLSALLTSSVVSVDLFEWRMHLIASCRTMLSALTRVRKVKRECYTDRGRTSSAKRKVYKLPAYLRYKHVPQKFPPLPPRMPNKLGAHLADFSYPILNIWCQRLRHLIPQIWNAQALSGHLNGVLRNEAHDE